MITILTKQNSIANHFLAELRDVRIQQDRMRFRRNLERLGEVMAYEISKTLEYFSADVETPLGVANTHLLHQQPVIATIMRAGLPFHQGLLNVFDRADSAFIAAYRHTKKSGEFEIHKKYQNTPNLDEKVVIMADPMLATGKSLVLCCKDLLSEYNIKELHIATVIASEEGLQHVQAFLPDVQIWVGAVDNELTSKSYIVPGLGDAGDLAFGNKE
ncbi:uracil phosphoribosyltransferase [Sphingobacterium sp. DK4209]|uniref:Uracil phosphoribosyltransferase n=1 Tax=Sphingobacterium zhuxiongii TaxID=2662364 RepID=A0A5Q0QDM3_9SPHI|nr:MULTISPECIES: uracil phosphoribosyltransferase [unclassified Sphingobacterium]MVZ67278.1 uracil phosphoribosyltransferase [Sphingobacterium sp. DK4209]QGA27623.1 uracil phosphoribosyltransferase [Sphingobacterium sp. dk4302]